MPTAKNLLRQALKTGEFAVTVEAVPGRGASEPSQRKTLEAMVEMWSTGRVHAVSVTDAPSGMPALPADDFACELLERGVQPLVHFTCKDRNRNQAEAQLYALQRRGVSNLLCMTGDAPTAGWQGRPRPVFDLDAVTLTQLACDMNAGMGYPRRGEVQRTAPAGFFPGAVVSPFKWTEGEAMLQLHKLQKKVAAGARFAISQVGYDARKMQEMLMLARARGIEVPLIANVYLLSAPAASFMNKGGIAGCDVSDELVELLCRERDSSADKGLSARLDRAAKMIAAARGMGYAGVHIGGAGLDASRLEYMLDKADEYAADWQAAARDVMFAKKGSWWAYEQDPETGLNSPTPTADQGDLFAEKDIRGNYRMSRTFHKLAFVPGAPLNAAFKAVAGRKGAEKGAGRGHALEHLAKTALYGCIDCGDCGLYACGYTCPMSRCPKCQRNGACGGSRDGWCEVYPGERRCVWYAAYHRLKHYGEQESLAGCIVPPVNWENWQKSPWSAMVEGRDGYARREWLPGVEPDREFLEGPKAHPDAPKRY